MKGLPLASASLMFLGLTTPIAAHPHVFVEARAEVVATGEMIEGIWAEWTFDEIFTSQLLADMDSNGNGQIDRSELDALKKGYFDNLIEFGFFSHVTTGENKVPIVRVTDFSAWISPSGRAVYKFFLPLLQPMDVKKPLAFTFFDDSYFADVVFAKPDPVSLKLSGPIHGSLSFKPNKSMSYYMGQIVPVEAVIQWSVTRE